MHCRVCLQWVVAPDCTCWLGLSMSSCCGMHKDVTKRRSSWACIGNSKPEQETIKGTHSQETSAYQRRPTTQHAAQGSNPPSTLSSSMHLLQGDAIGGTGITAQTTAGNPKRHTPRRRAGPRERTNNTKNLGRSTRTRPQTAGDDKKHVTRTGVALSSSMQCASATL